MPILEEENCHILSEILSQFNRGVPTDNKSALVQVMGWCQIDAKFLPEPMMVYFYDAYKHHPASIC